MKHQYRLTPKPGIARAGRFINTKVNPVIVSGRPNVIRTSNPSARKIPKNQQVKKAIVRNQGGRPASRRNLARTQIRSSPLKRRKELEFGLYKKAIRELHNSGKGKLLIMIACGPSILEVDLEKLKGHPLIDMMSINKPDPRVHPTKYWAFCDQSQYVRNKDTFEDYQGIVINTWSVRARHKNQILIKNKSGKGFSKDLLRGYYIGRSTTFANMQTAYWMNYDKVYIFGCDMCKPPNSDGMHFYGRNQDVDPAIRATRFAKEAEHYLNGSKQLSSEERKKFVFCSEYNPWSFVKNFEKMDHRVAVDHILEVANSKQK